MVQLDGKFRNLPKGNNAGPNQCWSVEWFLTNIPLLRGLLTWGLRKVLNLDHPKEFLNDLIIWSLPDIPWCSQDCWLNMPAKFANYTQNSESPKYLFWWSPPFGNIGWFNGLTKGLTHVCNFLWCSSHFSPDNPFRTPPLEQALLPLASLRLPTFNSEHDWSMPSKKAVHFKLDMQSYEIYLNMNLFVHVKLEIKLY